MMTRNFATTSGFHILSSGIFFAKAWSTLFSGINEVKVVIVGLNNAGKSTSMYQDQTRMTFTKMWKPDVVAKFLVIMVLPPSQKLCFPPNQALPDNNVNIWSAII